MPWFEIQYVTSGFTLCAFIVAIIAWILKKSTQEQRLRIESARPEDRASLVSQTLEFFNVDTAKLTKEQQYDIALKQIAARVERFRIIASVVVVLALIGASVSGYSIKAAQEAKKTASGGSKSTSPNVGHADLGGAGSDKIRFSLVSAVPNAPIEAKITKRNTGDLDALHVKGVGIVEIYDGSKDRDAICQDLEQRIYGPAHSGQSLLETAVPVGETYVINVSGRTLSDKEAKAIENGTLGVYVAGAFEYSDKNNYSGNWRFRKRLNRGNADSDCAGRPWNLSW